MILFISPAKTFQTNSIKSNQTPLFLKHSNKLITHFKSLSLNELKKAMHLSDKIANQTYDYYQNFNKNKQIAIYSYFGHQFKFIDANTFSDDDITYMNDHLFIISGLFGLLKPLDNISFYRLEIKDKSYINLYDYWTPILTKYLKDTLRDEILINLASDEYGQIMKDLKNTYTLNFFQIKDEKTSIHSMEVKKLRGLWVNHVIKNKIDSIDLLKKISLEGYTYHKILSNDKTITYTKDV